MTTTWLPFNLLRPKIVTVSLAYDGMGLGAAWGEEKATEMIREAGLEIVDVKQTETDPFNNFYIARKP